MLTNKRFNTLIKLLLSLFKKNDMRYSKADRRKIIKRICENVIEYNLSFNKAIEQSEISRALFYRWLVEDDELKDLYNYAREIRADVLFEELIDIADTTEEGSVTKITPGGTITEKFDMLGHRRLKIDTRKWVAGRMLPKKYGDKLDVTTDGESINKPLSAEEIAIAREKLKNEL